MQVFHENKNASTQVLPDLPAENEQNKSSAELCWDCLYPAIWSMRFKRWTCERCGY